MKYDDGSTDRVSLNNIANSECLGMQLSLRHMSINISRFYHHRKQSYVWMITSTNVQHSGTKMSSTKYFRFNPLIGKPGCFQLMRSIPTDGRHKAKEREALYDGISMVSMYHGRGRQSTPKQKASQRSPNLLAAIEVQQI